MRKPKYIDLLRLSNPWMVGHNVNRIVPLYLLHNFASNVFERGDKSNVVVQLCKGDPTVVHSLRCFESWDPTTTQLDLLQDSMFAVFSPDRRVFPSGLGSATPILASICSPTGSDDGLGNRVFNLVRQTLGTEWIERFRALLQPNDAADPVTALALALTEGKSVATKKVVPSKSLEEDSSDFENSIATFIDQLIRSVHSGARVGTIQELGRGSYFGALMLMLLGPTHRVGGHDSRVLVYGGRPPGSGNDPLTLAAAKSFKRAVQASYDAAIELLQLQLARVEVPEPIRPTENWAFRLRTLLTASNHIEAIVGEIQEDTRRTRNAPDVEWCRSVMTDRVRFDESEFARRVRGMGRHIGLVGPDRGRGHPRLFLETPLLGTIVRGICGNESMAFGDFVDALRTRFGFVIGVGNDDDTVSSLGNIWGNGDGEEALRDNEELFRMRLVRAGLAKTYSDSHTEVSSDVA